MLARMEPTLREKNVWMYPRLFWETGVLGQVLYLEAHAIGISATGIGCFFDNPGMILCFHHCFENICPVAVIFGKYFFFAPSPCHVISLLLQENDIASSIWFFLGFAFLTL